ncbi:MAG: hypothetical protein ACRDIL_17560 [Candidatus Limnocylindrales bacterium]
MVDVVGHDGDHLLGGERLEMVSGRLAEELLDAVVEEARLSDPIGADQQRRRDAWEQAAEDYGRLVADWVIDGYRRVAAG